MVLCPLQKRHIGVLTSLRILFVMGQPKRKHSKQRSRKRRGANRFKVPQLAKDADGSLMRPHRVNPETGQYRGRQVLALEV